MVVQRNVNSIQVERAAALGVWEILLRNLESTLILPRNHRPLQHHTLYLTLRSPSPVFVRLLLALDCLTTL